MTRYSGPFESSLVPVHVERECGPPPAWCGGFCPNIVAHAAGHPELKGGLDIDVLAAACAPPGRTRDH